MKTLVTGASGFIGCNLLPYLRRVAPETDISRFDHASGQDILNLDQLDNAVEQMELVIHLAARTDVAVSYDNPLTFYPVNVMGAANVFEAARRHGAKVIHISTCDVYGENRDHGKPMREDHPLDVRSPYAASKLGAEAVAWSYINCYAADIVILRVFNPYGPQDKMRKLIPTFLRLALSHQALPVQGGGDQRRDYTYVGDVVRAIWAARDLSAGTICNVCTGKATSVTEIAEMVSRLCGNTSSLARSDQARRSGEPKEVFGSFARLNKLTNWEPNVSLEEGIRLSRDWYLARGHIQLPGY